MKITLDNGDYQLELNAGGITGKDKDEVKGFAATVLCHMLLEMLTRYADDEEEVEVILTDGTNRDVMFCYSKEQTEGEDFDVKATRDLMHVHVLGERLAGFVQNPLRKLSPKEYVERCIKAVC